MVSTSRDKKPLVFWTSTTWSNYLRRLVQFAPARAIKYSQAIWREQTLSGRAARAAAGTRDKSFAQIKRHNDVTLTSRRRAVATKIRVHFPFGWKPNNRWESAAAAAVMLSRALSMFIRELHRFTAAALLLWLKSKRSGGRRSLNCQRREAESILLISLIYTERIRHERAEAAHKHSCYNWLDTAPSLGDNLITNT